MNAPAPTFPDTAPPPAAATIARALPSGAGRRELAGVLHALLDRGIVLRADVVLTLGGVPLAALQLQALLAGAQTLLETPAAAAVLSPAHPPSLSPALSSPLSPSAHGPLAFSAPTAGATVLAGFTAETPTSFAKGERHADGDDAAATGDPSRRHPAHRP